MKYVVRGSGRIAVDQQNESLGSSKRQVAIQVYDGQRMGIFSSRTIDPLRMREVCKIMDKLGHAEQFRLYGEKRGGELHLMPHEALGARESKPGRDVLETLARELQLSRILHGGKVVFEKRD